MMKLHAKQLWARTSTLFKGCMFTPGSVKLHVYDFTHGLLPWMSKRFAGESFFLGHTAVEVFGKEYYIDNNDGPKECAPGAWSRSYGMRRNTIVLGVTRHSQA